MLDDQIIPLCPTVPLYILYYVLVSSLFLILFAKLSLKRHLSTAPTMTRRNERRHLSGWLSLHYFMLVIAVVMVFAWHMAPPQEGLAATVSDATKPSIAMLHESHSGKPHS